MNMASEKEKKDEVKRILSRGSNKYVQESGDVKKENNKELTLTSRFTIKDYLQKAGDEYYINLNLQRNYAEARVDVSKRTTAIAQDYRSVKRQVVIFDIPEGYEVKYLPPSDKGYAEDAIGYNISYNVADGKVTMVKEITIPAMMTPVSRFDAYNKVIEGLKKNYKESVVLKATKK